MTSGEKPVVELKKRYSTGSRDGNGDRIITGNTRLID